MGGIRAPQKPFKYVEDVKISPQVVTKFVEKIVEVEKIVQDAELLNEVARLSARLKSEGEKVAHFQKILAETPDSPRVVEKIVNREVLVPQIVEKIVEKQVKIMQILPFYKDSKALMAILAALAVGTALGALI